MSAVIAESAPADFILHQVNQLPAAVLDEIIPHVIHQRDQKAEEERLMDLELLNVLAAKYGATVTWTKKRKEPNLKGSRRTNPVQVRFIDPEKPENTGSGRGRQPAWLQSYVANGRNPSEFMI